ncbi:hypothetical protein AGMMS50218_16990 [Actinomycetota bacterium]|nr:hypothetical protein AGMMS50218_16990 [Actinomycetota bacterium]
MSHRRRPTHPVRRVAAGAGLALGLVLMAAGPAAATDPINVTAQITDQVGALDGSTARVQDALDTLGDETVLDLYVVYVSDFSGAGGSQWADDTAVASHLGTEDVLLAVAVDERSFGLSVADDAPLTDAQITSIRTDLVEPALSDDDWAGAAVAAADGLRAAASGSSDSSGGQSDADDGGSGGGSLLLGLLLIGIVVILLVLVAVALTRRRRTPDPVGRVPGRSRGPAGPDALPTAELARRAGAALVAVDDAITTSDQELGFAQAQFGTAATAQFTTAVADARTQVAEAFRLQQLLDDAVPESEPEQRRILSTILETCQRVSASLDAHTQEFDRLRDLQARAPEVLDEAERAAQDVAATVQAARADLTTLAGAYPAAALASVAANPDQAEALLAGALTSVTTGRTALTSGDRGSAVGAARAAQEATAQAQRLLEAVGRAGAELARAGADLDAAIASITADLADVERLAPTDPPGAGGRRRGPAGGDRRPAGAYRR